MPERDGLDNLLDDVGLGKWQVLGIVINSLLYGVLPVHIMGTTFFNPPLDFYCSETASVAVKDLRVFKTNESEIIPYVSRDIFNSQCLDVGNTNESLSFMAEALEKVEETEQLSYHIEEQFVQDYEERIASTNIYEGISFQKTDLESCPFVAYDNAVFSTTVMTRWNLVCERSLYLTFFQDFHSYGMVIGCAIGGPIGDRFGRIRTALVASVAHAIGNIIVACVSNFPLVVLGRFIVGFNNFTVLINALTWSLETCPVKYRSPIGILTAVPGSVYVCFFALVGYFVRTWRLLYIAVCWPTLFIIPAAWYMDPSPRWLLRKDKLDVATEVVWKAIKINKADFESKEEVANVLKNAKLAADAEGAIQNNPGVYKEACSSPNMRYIFFAVALIQFFTKLPYYALFFFTDIFAESSPYTFMALSGVADTFGMLLGIPLLNRYGRKPGTAWTNILSGILVMLYLAVPDELEWLQWTLVLASFLLCSCTTQAQYVYVPELFPTVIRARGLGLASLFANLGAVVAPFVPWYLGTFDWWVTGATLGLFSLTAGLLGLTLPETLNVPSCETIYDVEKRAMEEKVKTQESLSFCRNSFLKLRNAFDSTTVRPYDLQIQEQFSARRESEERRNYGAVNNDDEEDEF